MSKRIQKANAISNAERIRQIMEQLYVANLSARQLTNTIKWAMDTLHPDVATHIAQEMKALNLEVQSKIASIENAESSFISSNGIYVSLTEAIVIASGALDEFKKLDIDGYSKRLNLLISSVHNSTGKQ